MRSFAPAPSTEAPRAEPWPPGRRCTPPTPVPRTGHRCGGSECSSLGADPQLRRRDERPVVLARPGEVARQFDVLPTLERAAPCLNRTLLAADLDEGLELRYGLHDQGPHHSHDLHHFPEEHAAATVREDRHELADRVLALDVVDGPLREDVPRVLVWDVGVAGAA